MHEKKLELLEAQHTLLNLLVYIAEQGEAKSGAPLKEDKTYADLGHMRDLVSRTILNPKNFFNKETLMMAHEFRRMKQDMGRRTLCQLQINLKNNIRSPTGCDTPGGF